MKIDGWRYYNSAAVPTTPPNVDPCTEAVTSGEIWELDGNPILARWTSCFDCKVETNWWYVIKDTPFDPDSLKAKRRYEVNKGKKNFEVRVIDPTEYCDQLFAVQTKAYEAYPAKYRPSCDKQSFEKNITGWRSYRVYAAFYRESGELCGYSLLRKTSDSWIEFSVQKTDPAFERYAVNAALVEGILDDNRKFLIGGGCICDGARSISHETAFQDYLEKYFGFRKAYCKLHLKYNPKVKWLVAILYPFRRILMAFDNVRIFHKINSVLKMEEEARKQK